MMYKKRNIITIFLCSISLLGQFFLPVSVLAAPVSQDNDPIVQCNKGLQLYADGKNSEALPFLEAGYNNRESANFENLDDLGACALVLGSLYEFMGKSTDALSAYIVALDAFTENNSTGNVGIALNNIGGVYLDRGQYEKALDYYRQALDIRQKLSDRTGEATTLNNIGLVHRLRGQYAKALEYYQQALVIWRKVGNRNGEVKTLSNIGMIYQAQGQYAKALEYLQQTLVIRRKLGDQVGEGKTLNNIGGVYQSQGLYVKALEYFQQALVIAQEAGDRPNVGTVLNNLGLVFDEQEQYAKALEYYQQALVIAREILDRGGEGTALHNIGNVYRQQGLYEKALEYYRQALAIWREVGDLPGEGTTLNSIGFVYDAQRQYSKAQEYYQNALAIFRQVGSLSEEGVTLNNIGEVYRAQGQYAKALEYYRQAITLLETVRTYAGNEQSRIQFIAQYAFLYDHAIELSIKENPLTAFQLSEQGRARAFLDSMSTGYIEINDNETSALYEKEQEIYTTRQAIKDALAKAKSQNPPDKQIIADLQSQLAQAEKDYTAALDAISAHGDQLQQLVPGRSKVLDVPQSQALLDNKTTLLSFWVLDDQTLVFILTPNTFNTVALPISRTDLYAKIKAFREFSNMDVAYPENAIELYHTIIEPLKTYLTTSDLVIVPHGELHYLPFSALTDGKRYLIDDYSIIYLPSVSAWSYIKQNVGGINTNPLILGNPTTSNIKLSPLPFAENEAQTIAGLYQAIPLLGKDATESAVHDQAKQAGLLHLAVHGSYNSANPLYSALYLAPDEQNDGLLEVHEIYGLDLHKTNLAVLSACETQLGELSSGDELVGLTRAFFFAGTPTVVASLWSVDDEATGMLMKQFYTHMKEGLGKAEALRQAQLEVREKYPNPYYWAGFVLSGDGGTINAIQAVPVNPKTNTILLLAILVCCLFGAGVISLAASVFLWLRHRK